MLDSISLQAFLGVYLGGLLSAFTPCVYPMIPITIGIMGVQKAHSVFKAFLLSICFVLGLAAVYATLGFTAASTGKLLGSISQSPWLVQTMAFIFLAMGLSLLGLFDFQLPYQFTNWVTRFGHAGYAGSFVLGMVSGVLAAPCSGPVVVGILAYVAQKTNPIAGFALLFIFSLGLGTPFLILGTFSSSIHRIPKTGVWTEWTKHICGLALIGAFFYYFERLVSPSLFFGILAGSLIAAGIWFQNIFPLTKPNVRFHAAGRILMFVLAGFFVFNGIKHNSPPSDAKLEPKWMTYENGLATAKKEGKPIMIDFWAEWCEACHELDDQTYSDPSVHALISQKFVAVKIDATDPPSDPKVTDLIAKYEVTGLPTVLFLTPDGKLLSKLTFTGFLPPHDFTELLQKALLAKAS